MGRTQNTFHLGITMTGVVSAGVYTVGFMDCFIKVLELWKEVIQGSKKNGFLP